VPSTNIAVLYTVEWLLDRVRTCVNMYGHCFSTVITYELSKNNMDECSQITSTGAFTLDEDVQLSRVHSQKQSRENTIETI
jgi:Na+/H+-dicarboxylate symporter